MLTEKTTPVLHRIGNEFLTVTASEQGAELWSLKGRDGTEYLWQGDRTYWTDRAPNLFPYVARLTEPKGATGWTENAGTWTSTALRPIAAFSWRKSQTAI